MVKYQSRTIGGIAILLMLGFPPLSVTYSFGDSDQSKQIMNQKTLKVNKKRGLLRAILTEKMVNGKLEVRQYSPYLKILLRRICIEWYHLMERHQDGHMSITRLTNQEFVLFDGKALKMGIIYGKFLQMGL